MASIAVVAPHPDDETLGAGGSLLRHAAQGDDVHWIIATSIPVETSFGGLDGATRQVEIEVVGRAFGFASIQQLPNEPARLDTVPLGDLVRQVQAAIATVAPSTVYVPWPGDAHSDHRLTFEAVVAATKSFRSQTVTQILAYETLSETNFATNPLVPMFRPTRFHDVTGFFSAKLEILGHWTSEVHEHPWPRSETAVTSLATLRGSECGAMYAEAFAVIRDFA